MSLISSVKHLRAILTPTSLYLYIVSTYLVKSKKQFAGVNGTSRNTFMHN